MTDKQKKAIQVINKVKDICKYNDDFTDDDYMFLLEIVIDSFCMTTLKDDMLDLERRLITLIENRHFETNERISKLELKPQTWTDKPYEPLTPMYKTNGVDYPVGNSSTGNPVQLTDTTSKDKELPKDDIYFTQTPKRYE